MPTKEDILWEDYPNLKYKVIRLQAIVEKIMDHIWSKEAQERIFNDLETELEKDSNRKLGII